MTAALELDDIQGLLVRGYGTLPEASFVLLTVLDAAAARRTVADWAGQLTTGREKPTGTALNLALTSAGVTLLAPSTPEDVFSEQFVSGMTTPYRSRLLGDVDDDDPREWTWGGPSARPVHVLLLVYAATPEDLTTRCAELTTAATAGGLDLVSVLETSTLGPDEGFGFHDGISQPAVEGLGGGPHRPGEVRAGEFVLGYPNEYGQRVEEPLLRNGSYLVLRTLRQDVDAFHAFTEAATRDAHGRADAQRQALLEAKMVGRWPSGASLVLAPGGDDPRTDSTDNDFGYHLADPRGLACPLGSHVRRANPRDSLDPQPGTEKSLAINRRHRLLRRGRAYGLGAPEGERGVHFICLGANLARQYEFVQHTWVNNPVFNGLDGETDPLVGVRRGKQASFTVPARPVRRRYAELPQFVHVRGGAYFFLPGRRALQRLTG